MKQIAKDNLPKPHTPIILYSSNTTFPGHQFYLMTRDNSTFWVSCDDPNVIIQIEDTDEWESLDWLTG